jgi:hypothetical protein
MAASQMCPGRLSCPENDPWDLSEAERSLAVDAVSRKSGGVRRRSGRSQAPDHASDSASRAAFAACPGCGRSG